MQFGLRSLFHLCSLAGALALCVQGAQSGRLANVVPPLFMLGVCYTLIVAYRLRKTIARFPWDVAKFSGSWIFLIIYAAIAISYFQTAPNPLLPRRSLVLDTFNKNLSWGLSPFAMWAAYLVMQTYWRAKFEPEEDYC